MKKIINSTLGAFAMAAMLFVASCTTDPCAKVTCQNSGTCANGSCNCPSGYGGSDCGTQKTPSKVRISKIEVLDFKATNASGGGWDLTSGADIFPVIANGAGTPILWQAATYQGDATPGSVYTWDIVPALDADATTPYIFALYDDDYPLSPERVGGLVVAPFELGKGFPSTWVWQASDGSLKVRLTVTYVY